MTFKEQFEQKLKEFNTLDEKLAFHDGVAWCLQFHIDELKNEKAN